MQQNDVSIVQKINYLLNSKQGQNDNTVYIFAIVSLIFSFIYVLLFLYALSRYKIFRTSSRKTISGKIMYSFIIALCAFITSINTYEAITTIGQVQQDGEQKENNFLLVWQVTVDLFLFDIVFMYLWQVFIVYYQGHVQKGNFSQSTKYTPLKKKVRITVISILIIINTYFIVLAGLLYAVFYGKFNSQFVDRVCSLSFYSSLVATSSIILLIIISHIYLLQYFSGVPYISTLFNKRIRHLNKLSLFLVISRATELFVSLFSEIRIFSSANSHTNTSLAILELFWLVGSYFITDILPLLMLLNISTVNIFILDDKSNYSFHQNQNENDISMTINQAHRDSIYEQLVRSNSGDANEIPKIDVSQIQLCDNNLTKSKGLGLVQEGKYLKDKSKHYFIREFCADQLSHYIIEDIQSDIDFYLNLNCDKIQKVRYLAQNDNKFMLISNFYQFGNLYDLLNNKSKISQIINDKQQKYGDENHQIIQNQQQQKQNFDDSQSNILQNSILQYQDNKKLSLQSKISIAIQIADVMKELHYSFDEPIIHGHLTPQNILLNDQCQIVISDVGQKKLKSFMGYKGYINKSQYTAPEILSKRGNVVGIGSQEGDVYSFGMILWEIFTDNVPFQDLPLKEIKKRVAEDNTRPKIPEENSFGTELAILIRSCWQKDPELRPDFNTVLNLLKNYKYQIQ